jgi:type 1 glutamine amidotransferase
MNPRVILPLLAAAFLFGCGQEVPKEEPVPDKQKVPKRAAAKEEGAGDVNTGEREVTQKPARINVLSIGGGTSHEFGKWFNENDSACLAGTADCRVDYTEQTQNLPGEILKHDVIYLTANQPLDSLTRVSLTSFVDTGHGMVIVHPALWYNWLDWPEYNRNIVGGGATKHDAYGDFIVTVTDTEHPIMKDVPTSFRVTDELYHFEKDEQGTPIKVLATAKNLKTGDTYPAVWVVQHPKAHIVCITLGHDGATHQNPAYHTLLKNSVQWAAIR